MFSVFVCLMAERPLTMSSSSFALSTSSIEEEEERTRNRFALAFFFGPLDDDDEEEEEEEDAALVAVVLDATTNAFIFLREDALFYLTKCICIYISRAIDEFLKIFFLHFSSKFTPVVRLQREREKETRRKTLAHTHASKTSSGRHPPHAHVARKAFPARPRRRGDHRGGSFRRFSLVPFREL